MITYYRQMTNLNELNRLIKYHRQQIIVLKKKVDNINDINIKEAFNLNIKMFTVQLKMLKIYFNKNYNNLDNSNNISIYEEDDIDLEKILNNSVFNENEGNEELEDINKVITNNNTQDNNLDENTGDNELYENTEENEIENTDENELNENTEEKINIDNSHLEDDVILTKKNNKLKNKNGDNNDDDNESDDNKDDDNQSEEESDDNEESYNNSDEENNESDNDESDNDESNNKTIKSKYTKESLLLLDSLKIKELCKLHNSRFFNDKEKCINNLLKKLKE